MAKKSDGKSRIVGGGILLGGRDALDYLDDLTKKLRDFGGAVKDAGQGLGAVTDGSGVPGGGTPRGAGGGASPAAAAGSAFGGAVGRGISVLDNAFAGGIARSSGVSAAETSARGFVNMAIEAPAAALEKIPGIGGSLAELYRKQGSLVERGAFQPLERANARIGAIAGDLAAAGGQLSDKDLQMSTQVAIEQERRRLLAERKVASLTFSAGNVQDALSFGWRAAGF